MRRYFGTDGVRGIVGESLTTELVERLGRAAALWSGRGRVFIGRDTRGSGPMLENAFAEGVASVGGNAVSGSLEIGDVAVTGGVFTVELDFGIVPFSLAEAKWLLIEIRPGASSGAYTPLPRQHLTPTPTALGLSLPLAQTASGPPWRRSSRRSPTSGPSRATPARAT